MLNCKHNKQAHKTLSSGRPKMIIEGTCTWKIPFRETWNYKQKKSIYGTVCSGGPETVRRKKIHMEQKKHTYGTKTCINNLLSIICVSVVRRRLPAVLTISGRKKSEAESSVPRER
jgi:hypothetical protein